MTVSQTVADNIENATHSVPVYQNYACYRTVASGWQEAGYIVVTGSFCLESPPPAPDAAPWWENTAWVLDPDGKYKISQTYPELAKEPNK